MSYVQACHLLLLTGLYFTPLPAMLESPSASPRASPGHPSYSKSD